MRQRRIYRQWDKTYLKRRFKLLLKHRLGDRGEEVRRSKGLLRL